MMWSINSNKDGRGLKTDTLLEALIKLEAAMPGAATRNPKAGLRHTIAFLKKHPGSTVDDLANQLFQSKPPPAKKKPAVALKAAVVDEQVQALKNAESSTSAFAKALDQLKSDKRVRLVELKEIVKQYTGAPVPVKSKAAGLEIIDHNFDQRWKLKNR